MPIALSFLAATLALTVVLGPLGFGILQWHVSAIGLNQTLGADGASLVVVVPVAAAAARLWMQRHRLAPPLALGVGAATLYYCVAAVLGADYIRYPGNNERFFPVLLLLFILSWTITVRAWSAIDAALPPPATWLRRSLSVVLLLVAAALGLVWLRQLFELSVNGTFALPADAIAYDDSPGAFWTVRIVDLGLIVPISIATGLGLWRGSGLAVRAAYGVTAFLVLQAVSVLCMGTIMLVRQDPSATPALVLVLAPISVGLTALTALLFASSLRTAQQSSTCV